MLGLPGATHLPLISSSIRALGASASSACVFTLYPPESVPNSGNAQSGCSGQCQGCVSQVSSAPPLIPASARSYATSARSVAASQGTGDGDWRSAVRTQFSIRPSLLSPLYPAYRQEQAHEARRQLLRKLLEAHSLLANEIDGLDEVQMERTARHRSNALRQLSSMLESLAPRGNLATCTDRSLALGFYSLLEQQVTSGSLPVQQISQQQTQPRARASLFPSAPSTSGSVGSLKPEEEDAEAYHKLETGQVDVFTLWQERFAGRYAGTPSLEPLETIYGSTDILVAMKQLEAGGGPAARGRNRAALAPAGSVDREAIAARKARSLVQDCGARMDVSGTVLSEGKRKTSVARVLLRPGAGLIMINGKPYDEFFPDLSVRAHVVQPFFAAPQTLCAYDADVQVQGGGPSAQAQAIRTGIARALMLFSDSIGTPHALYRLSKLTRYDRRRRERMKPAKKGPRAGYAWVKR